MPTGYTAGIIDGTTETFQKFAKQCMRNFGAAIHMRDDNMDKEYEPRTPRDYHNDEMKIAKNKLKQSEEFTDIELIEIKKNEIEEGRTFHEKKIEEIKIARKRLDEFLIKAKEFHPPTSEHEGIAKFMIDQIEGTINSDGNTKYHDDALLRIDSDLQSINPGLIRLSLKESAQEEYRYHSKEHRKELKRCKDSNFWAVQFFEAIQ